MAMAGSLIGNSFNNIVTRFNWYIGFKYSDRKEGTSHKMSIYSPNNNRSK